MKKIISICVTVALLLSVCTSIVCGAAPNEEAGRGVIYIAENGDDANEGTIDKPLKTFHGARDKIRALKNEGVSYPKGFVVYARQGDYLFDESLELTKDDSGTESAPIVYRSYPGETATLIGGVKISGKDLKR